MTPGPITSWQIDGETVQTVTDFILGGCKITADGDCIHEIEGGLGWGIHVNPWLIMSMYNKNHYSIVK